MGVVLNPLALKLGYTISWLDAWVAHRIIYSTFLHNILKLRLLLNYVFFIYLNKKRMYWIYSHCNIFIFSNQIFMNLYLYSMRFKRWRFRSAFKGLRYVRWNKLRVKSQWYKYQTIDRHVFAQRLFRFTRSIRLFYDFLNFANLGPLLSWDKEYLKIKKLKKKKNNTWSGRLLTKIKNKLYLDSQKIYSKNNNIIVIKNISKPYLKFNRRKKKKTHWIAREELYVLKKVYLKMMRRLNSFSSKWWSYYYNIYYSKKFSIQKENRKFWSYKNVFKTEIAKSNIKLMIFFKSFLNKFFKKFTPQYPSLVFYFRSTLKFMKFYIYFFIRKRILFFYKKYIQLISLYLNIFINVKIFIIGKKSVTSQFLVNYICFGFRNKESFNYMMKPIRSVLTDLLHTKYKPQESLLEEKSENDVVVPLLEHFKHDYIYVINFLKIKISLLIKKLIKVFFYFKLHKSNLYRFILFNFKCKHFIVTKNKFFTYNINKIIKINSCTFVKFSYINNIIEKKYKKNEKYEIFIRSFIKKNSLLKLFYYKKIFSRQFFNIYFFFTLKFDKSNINIKKFFLKYILFYINYKKIFLSNYIFSKLKYKKKNLIFYNNKFLIFNLLYRYMIYQNTKTFVYKLFDDTNLNAEYDYICNYYNASFDFKNLTYYEKRFKGAYNHCKRRFLWMKNDVYFLINEFSNQWKKYNFMDSYDFILYWGAVNTFKSIRKWFRKQTIWYKKLIRFFNKQKIYPKIIITNYNLSFTNYVLMPRQYTYMYINKISFILFFFYENIIFFLIFIRALIKTRIKNSFINNNYFYIIFGYLYFNLMEKNLIYQIPVIFDGIWQFINKFFYNNKFFFYNEIIQIQKKIINNKYLIIYFFNLKKYKKYLLYLNFFNKLDYNKVIIEKKIVESPLMKKKTRIDFFFGHSPLYGYKFHFTGRFTRKQKSANLWFQVGYLENSSIISKIDYAFKFIVLRFSVCSIKVWLYKSRKYATYRYNVFV